MKTMLEIETSMHKVLIAGKISIKPCVVALDGCGLSEEWVVTTED